MTLSERRLFIVEDEPLIAMMIEDMAKELGWEISGIAHNETAAFALLGQSDPTLALLDIHLGPTPSFGVATACTDRAIPVVFTSGDPRQVLPAEHDGAPVLAKPFSPVDLERALLQGAALVVKQRPEAG